MPRRTPRSAADARRAGVAPLHELRIIGGEWRGRRFRFPATATGIRPTPDRVRETLYNWLQGRVAGARALDLYAGSGALGLEALSRGAREVVFVDVDRLASRSIESTLATLASERGRVVTASAAAYLAGPATPFDLVFVDPPYASGEVGAVCEALVAGSWLADDARIYLECPASAGEPQLPDGWQLLRSKRAGEVGYHLAGNKPA
jgi:16S rRNA (guanine966-N2)-methyltransferase